VDPKGLTEPAEFAETVISQLALSPDGRRVAVVAASGQVSDIWNADLDRGAMNRLTFDGAANPVWSPDGAWVFYTRGASGPGGAGDVYRRRADGSGEAESVWQDGGALVPMSLSPDGSYLAVERSSAFGPSDIWILPLGGDEKPWPFVEGPFNAFMAEFSPDGRWLAYMSNESGRPEVYVRTFPGSGGRWQISTASGLEPRWSPRGDELFYRSGTGGVYSVPINTRDGFVAGQPRLLFGGVHTGTNPRTYSIAADGARFLALIRDPSADKDRVHLALGWDAEVARLTAPRR
jgi:eukaryotic-like serine/threonine-protein kinase